jgi:predicted kinase
MNKHLVTVNVGVPGSGKSYQSQQQSSNCIIFSSDWYREHLFGDINDQEHNGEVFNTLYTDVENILKQSEPKHIIIDATNITRKSRARVIQLAKQYDSAIEALVFNTSRDVCIVADAHRERTVGKNVIDNMIHRFEIPTRYEGFDYVRFTHNIVETDSSKRTTMRATLFDIMNSFDQHNHHHLYSLGEHCNRFLSQVITRVPSEQERTKLAEVALWHDIGKMYTQTFDDKGEAHYYDHANVGVYKLITDLKVLCDCTTLGDPTDSLVHDVLFYINMHMIGHNMNFDKNIKYIQPKYQNEIKTKLKIIAEFDRQATGTE